MSKILGLSVSVSQLAYEKDTKIIKYRDDMAEQFRAYAYGNENQIGLHKILDKVDGDYSTDLDLIFFYFKVNPTENEPPRKDIDSYKPKQKSIVAWIEINEDNFFNKSTQKQDAYAKGMIIERLIQIKKRFERSKLAVDMDRLIHDTKIVLNL